MAEELRAQVRERFRASCAYCGVHEDAVGATLTVDHYRPRAHGGADEEENLVYCCARCNEHKGAYWHEHDPPHVRLLHPGQDDLTQYLHESDDGRIVGLALEGEFFSQRLRLNRPQLVAYRRARQVEAKLTVELAANRRRVEELERTVIALRAALESIAEEIERRSKGRQEEE